MLSTTYARVDRQSFPISRTDGGGLREPDSLESERALQELVRLALRGAGYSALRELEIEVSDGVVILWGRVATYYQKQLAQVVAQRVDGVRGIANGLEVICQRVNDRAEGC